MRIRAEVRAERSVPATFPHPPASLQRYVGARSACACFAPLRPKGGKAARSA